jgi:hypothetical protein
MTFRSLDAVNGLRPPEAARETRAIDSVQTSEKEASMSDGALGQNAASVAKPPSEKSSARREGAKAPQRPGRPNGEFASGCRNARRDAGSWAQSGFARAFLSAFGLRA